VRVRCYLREHRARRSLSKIADAIDVKGLGVGQLSLIEQGRMIPKDSQMAALERAYGVPRSEWWPREVLLVLELDDEGTRERDGEDRGER
jgi:transcriptional regulator with XRE-family HTH domain